MLIVPRFRTPITVSGQVASAHTSGHTGFTEDPCQCGETTVVLGRGQRVAPHPLAQRLVGLSPQPPPTPLAPPAADSP